MQRVLTQDLWKEVSARARKALGRRAAIAYVTKDLLHLGRGDVLITNASTACIAGGNTDAKLLRRLSRKGVAVYHCEDLHAKVVLLDLPNGKIAVVGSANMSGSSGTLVEAGLLTDNASIASGVESLIEQLQNPRALLSKKQLEELCCIKVIRRGGRPTIAGQRRTKIGPLGHQTWIVGLHEIDDDSDEAKSELTKAAAATGLRSADLAYVEWGINSRFARECREGDLVILIWRPSAKAKRVSEVAKATAVLRKQTTKSTTRFYVRYHSSGSKHISFSQFKALLKRVGYAREVKPQSLHLVEGELADAISRKWRASARRR